MRQLCSKRVNVGGIVTDVSTLGDTFGNTLIVRMGECRLKGGLMIARLRPRRRRDDGAAAVELALVLPILLLLLFGIISFGIVFAQKLALSNAAREAARFGTVGLTTSDRPTCQQITDRVRAALTNTIALTPSDVTIKITRGPDGTGSNPCGAPGNLPCAGSATADELRVAADFDSQLLIPLGPIVNKLPISGQGVYRCEYK